MKYQLRNFEDNYTMVSSLGWVLLLIAMALVITQQRLEMLPIAVLGGLLVVWQYRGKRIVVDTSARVVKSGRYKHVISEPRRILIKKVRYSQNVHSRVSSAQVQSCFFKAYLEDGDRNILLSSNKNEARDMKRLQSIARDLRVEVLKNY